MKILYFDKSCRVCKVSTKIVSASGISTKANFKPLQQIDIKEMCSIDAARYCNELAVLDTQSKEVKYGISGILWYLEDKWGKWLSIFLFPPIFQLLNFLYLIFSYNRRMIAPVYEKLDKDCQPNFHWGFRLSYIFLAGIFSLFSSYWLGNALKGYFDSALSYVLLVVVGWILHSLFIQIYSVKEKMEYYGHLTTVVLSGTLVQIPFLLLFGFWPNNYMLLFSIVLSDIFMLYAHYKRVKYLQISQWVTVSWWITIHLSALYHKTT